MLGAMNFALSKKELCIPEAKHAGASVSTLLRKFKSEIKQTPYSHIKNRRLEEALNLLQNTSQSVGEVALLVGYENFGAFKKFLKSS
jgi:transcriptional regulator GlxA family with amidase domain